jgi:hypothetical protein
MGILLTPMYLSHLKPQLRKALLYQNEAPRTRNYRVCFVLSFESFYKFAYSVNYVFNRRDVERIVAELKQILKKDFNRQMVEGSAFKGKLQFYKCVGVNIV